MHYNYDFFARTEMDGKFIKRVIIITRFVRKEDVFESEFKKRRNNVYWNTIRMELRQF